ncbi:hypothetical protein SAMD00019534_116050 [Acytostelium subglobosum LB1]|uniref:hypothetical protein n=1 Tax=Acytostelium subglobosum LB1 TaxID=1410327 RepID=UPI000644B64A|nr:hypothetical protein SAMD00019534_116050 [Acytostelium subglobosum LB1]GAM28429.1 hypothetical protein SAMD00019534_116050 [Acytostelium subglobosum LB1]|eukprot:XP_012748746.1 hypothetical protein SAMD00019534_116050 [Acytostelium subglobosum LB1]
MAATASPTASPTTSPTATPSPSPAHTATTTSTSVIMTPDYSLAAANLTEEFIAKEKIRLWTIALQSRLELSSRMMKPKWRFVSEIDGIKYWKLDEPTNDTTHTSKSEIIVNKSSSTVMHFMSDLSRIHMWNKYLSSCNKVCDLIERLSVYHDSELLHGCPHLWLPGRDSLMIKYSGPHPTMPKTFVRVVKSVESPLCPKLPGYTRTQVLSGFVVEELAEHRSRITNVIFHDFCVANPPSVWDTWLVPFIAKCDSWTLNKMAKLKYFIELEPNFTGEIPVDRRTKKSQQIQQRGQKKQRNSNANTGANANPFNNIVFVNVFENGLTSKSTATSTTSTTSTTSSFQPAEEVHALGSKRKVEQPPRIIDFDDERLFSPDPKLKAQRLLTFLQGLKLTEVVSCPQITIDTAKVTVAQFESVSQHQPSSHQHHVDLGGDVGSGVGNGSINSIINSNSSNNSVHNLIVNNSESEATSLDNILRQQLDIKDYITSTTSQGTNEEECYRIYRARFSTKSPPSSILFSLLDGDIRRKWSPYVIDTNELWEKNNTAAMEVHSYAVLLADGRSIRVELDYHLRVSQHLLSAYFPNDANNVLVTLEERSNSDILLIRQENDTIDENHRTIDFIYFSKSTNWLWANELVDNTLSNLNFDHNYNYTPTSNDSRNGHPQHHGGVNGSVNGSGNGNGGCSGNYSNNVHGGNRSSPHHQFSIVNFNFLDHLMLKASISFKDVLEEECRKINHLHM